MGNCVFYSIENGLNKTNDEAYWILNEHCQDGYYKNYHHRFFSWHLNYEMASGHVKNMTQSAYLYERALESERNLLFGDPDPPWTWQNFLDFLHDAGAKWTWKAKDS